MRTVKRLLIVSLVLLSGQMFAQTTNYQVVGFSRNTCPNDTGFVLVTVADLPKVDLGPDRPGVVRAIYWSKSAEAGTSIAVSAPMRISLYACMAGMLYLGLFPNALVKVAAEAVKALKL